MIMATQIRESEIKRLVGELHSLILAERERNTVL